MSNEEIPPPDQWRHVLKLGMKGRDVRAWQLQLISDGHDLGPARDDGDFGRMTHNATVSWQKDRQLNGDGAVGPKTRTLIGASPVQLPAPTHEELRDIPMIEARNYTRIVRQEVRLIVIHSMEAAEASSTAENVCRWAAGPSAPRASWHYAVDDDSIVQCVPENMIAWHAAGANRIGIGIEHAGYARQTREQWDDQFSRRMLQRSALLSASICRRWGIPAECLSVDDVKNGRKGFVSHDTVSKAFGKSDHYDPGPSFPWERYLEMVQRAIDETG